VLAFIVTGCGVAVHLLAPGGEPWTSILVLVKNTTLSPDELVELLNTYLGWRHWQNSTCDIRTTARLFHFAPTACCDRVRAGVAGVYTRFSFYGKLGKWASDTIFGALLRHWANERHPSISRAFRDRSKSFPFFLRFEHRLRSVSGRSVE